MFNLWYLPTDIFETIFCTRISYKKRDHRLEINNIIKLITINTKSNIWSNLCIVLFYIIFVKPFSRTIIHQLVERYFFSLNTQVRMVSSARVRIIYNMHFAIILIIILCAPHYSASIASCPNLLCCLNGWLSHGKRSL